LLEISDSKLFDPNNRFLNKIFGSLKPTDDIYPSQPYTYRSYTPIGNDYCIDAYEELITLTLSFIWTDPYGEFLPPRKFVYNYIGSKTRPPCDVSTFCVYVCMDVWMDVPV
jgi:hypothetical protein